VNDANSGPLSPDRPDVEREFRVDAPFDPAGDQPDAIEDFVGRFELYHFYE